MKKKKLCNTCKDYIVCRPQCSSIFECKNYTNIDFNAEKNKVFSNINWSLVFAFAKDILQSSIADKIAKDILKNIDTKKIKKYFNEELNKDLDK